MVMMEGEKAGGTVTTMGFIPHLERFGYQLPIQVEFNPRRSMNQTPAPRIRGNMSSWALPGGGRYLSFEPVVCFPLDAGT